MPFSVNAADIIDQGSYGNNITWTIDDEGKLIVSGTGEMPMPDYTEYDTVAWYSYRSIIKNVVIEHSYTSKVIKESTCTSTGEVLYTCECGHSYTETVAAADHTDENGDFICEVCGKEINFCSHLCHRNNIFAKIVWKIIIFICEIFGLSKTCTCGRSHY